MEREVGVTPDRRVAGAKAWAVSGEGARRSPGWAAAASGVWSRE